MKLVKAGLLQRGNKVSINGALLEVQRVIPTAHKEPTVVIVFTNGRSYIAKASEVLFVQIPEGGISVNNYDGHQQQNFGQQQPIQQPIQPQGNWQPGMQPIPPNQKKPFFKRTWVIVTGAVLAVFIIIGIASGGGDTNNATTPTGGETSAAKPVASEKPSQKPAESKKTTQAPAAKKWVKLVTLTGTADKQSDTIKTTGGKIRLSYTFKDTSSVGGIGGIYFLKEGTDLQKDGGIPEVMISEAGKDTTTLRKDAGEYFVKVSSANFKYTVVVEEER